MKLDGRTLDHQSSETIRLMAIKRIKEDNEKPSQVIKSYGLNRTTIYLWLKKYKVGGYEALKSSKATGRPKILSKQEMSKLQKLIIGKNPRRYGFDFGLWSLRLVCDLVLNNFSKKISVPTAQRLLHELGIMPQRPLSKSYEQDSEKFTKWKEEIYPGIKKKATQMGAEICFSDESGFNSRENHGRTWGEKGKTPIVKKYKKHQSVSAISIINSKGNFFYDVYSGKLNGEKFVEILKKFMRYRRKPAFIIVDNLSVHKSEVVKDYLDSPGKKLQFFLPPYSPELNPVEFVWNNAKQNGVSKSRLIKKTKKLKPE